MTDEQDSLNQSNEPSENSRSRGFLKPKAQSDPSPANEPVVLYGEARKAAMRNVEPLEKRLGYGAAILALIFGSFYCYIGLTATNTPDTKPVNGKCSLDYKLEHAKSAGKTITYCALQRGHSYYAYLAVTMAIFVIAIAISARIGRRVALAFTVLLTGFALSDAAGLAVAVPFILMGGWLMLRAWRMQKFGTTDARTVAKINAQARQDRKNGVKSNFQEPAPSSKSAGGPRANSTQAPGNFESKRYTPKKPVPKKRAPLPEPKEQGRVSKWLKGENPPNS